MMVVSVFFILFDNLLIPANEYNTENNTSDEEGFIY